jgi:hypothetical protein
MVDGSFQIFAENGRRMDDSKCLPLTLTRLAPSSDSADAALIARLKRRSRARNTSSARIVTGSLVERRSTWRRQKQDVLVAQPYRLRLGNATILSNARYFITRRNLLIHGNVLIGCNVLIVVMSRRHAARS